jgi:AcrR family transcriptional regulator
MRVVGRTTEAGKRVYAPRLPAPQRREQLLDAALAVIADRGFDAVTMESVARTAGVAKPVLYGLYPNREQLLHALLEREEQRALEQMAAVIQPSVAERRPDEIFTAAVRAFLGAVLERPESWRIMLLPPEGTPAEVRDRFERARSDVLAQARRLAEWAAGRQPDCGLDPELLAHAMVSCAEMAARLVLSDPDRYPPDRLTAFVATLASTVLPPA